MALQIGTANHSLLKFGNGHRFAKLWTITRIDGTIFHFTDHPHDIAVGGNLFKPALYDGSASRKEDGFRPPNVSFRGALDSADITYEDMRAGLFLGAAVIEEIRDWRYLWVGFFKRVDYTITRTKFDGEVWQVECEGIQRLLQGQQGHLVSKTCRYQLGDDRCTVTLASFTNAGAVTDVTTAGLNNRDHFFTDLNEVDDFYEFGEIVWTSGANNGIRSEIKEYKQTSGEITFYLRTPFEISVTDAFSAIAGCDKRHGSGGAGTGDCINKFANGIFFGGFPFIPGRNALMATP